MSEQGAILFRANYNENRIKPTLAKQSVIVIENFFFCWKLQKKVTLGGSSAEDNAKTALFTDFYPRSVIHETVTHAHFEGQMLCVGHNIPWPHHCAIYESD